MFFKSTQFRVEFFWNFSLNSYNIVNLICFIRYVYTIVPLNKTLQKKRLIYIYFLDLISSYRGWRHSRGLPVRGQRTWTNAWSVYKSNLVLREYRINVSKQIYGSIQINHLSVAYLAEQINLLWKLQWEDEWRSAKKKRLLATQNENSLQKIDLLSMSKGIIGNFKSKKQKSKQTKKSKQQNLLTLGFEPGFTKALLKVNYINKKIISKKNKTVLILDKNLVKKKKNIKKAVVTKKTIKKTKNSNAWD